MEGFGAVDEVGFEVAHTCEELLVVLAQLIVLRLQIVDLRLEASDEVLHGPERGLDGCAFLQRCHMLGFGRGGMSCRGRFVRKGR